MLPNYIWFRVPIRKQPHQEKRKIKVITMEIELFFVLFGWLLGLLSSVITAYFNDCRKSKKIKTVICNELIELQHRLVLAAYLYNLDYGEINHEFLRWIRNHLSSYKGINKYENIEKSVDSLLEMPENVLHRFVAGQRDGTKGKSVKHARIPYLVSQLHNIGSFSSKEQSILLEILEHTQIYNETVDEAINFLSMTFDQGITGNNREIVEKSLKEKYIQLAERSRIIVKRVNAFSNCCKFRQISKCVAC